MIELLNYVFMQRAFIGGILIGTACSFIGIFLVLRKLSLLSDGLAHMAFGGIALALLLGLNPLLTTLVFTSLGALFVQRMIKKTQIYGDSATAVILAFGMAVAIIIIGAVNGFTVDLFSFLFGSILTLSTVDLLLIAIVFAIVVSFILFFYRKLQFITFNPELAKLDNINVNLLDTIFIIITAMTTVIAIRAVGILLISALLVLPTIISLQLARSFKQLLFFALLSSLIAIIVGLTLAFYLNLPPSGIIVMLLCFFFGVTLLFRKK